MTDHSEIVRQIQSYLEEHPGAGVTLEGIATWWIQRQRVDETVTTVYQALQELKASGRVLERKAPDGKTLYFLRDVA
jgi:Fe2+ or Zn2+ uptake regulation protein